MQGVFPEAEVYEINKVKLKSPIIFAGFVGAGLVGSIAIDCMIKKLQMKEIAYMRSKYLPPSTVFMNGRLRHPFRFYANKEGTICAIICEITLRMEGLYTIAGTILDWAKEKEFTDYINDLLTVVKYFKKSEILDSVYFSYYRALKRKRRGLEKLGIFEKEKKRLNKMGKAKKLPGRERYKEELIQLIRKKSS